MTHLSLSLTHTHTHTHTAGARVRTTAHVAPRGHCQCSRHACAATTPPTAATRPATMSRVKRGTQIVQKAQCAHEHGAAGSTRSAAAR